MNIKRISIIGLGKLGSPMAAVFAQKGFFVTGVDKNEAFVSRINEGIAPVNEPLLQEFVQSSRARLKATTSYRDAVHNSDATFVILPTPSDDSGFFSNDFLVEAAKLIGEALKSKSGYHLVVITSTVMPGSTNGIIRETLENASGRQVGENLGLCYSPEFIALGNVINDMLAPDFVLIGESDPRAGDLLQEIYLQTCNNQPEIKRMNFVNAELTKIAVNTFVTTKISYANMLSEYCDRLEDADVDVVTDAVGSDSRIGKKYLKAALGYGGPCFPRDNKAFSALGHEIGAKSNLADATDAINEHQVERLYQKVKSLMGQNDSVTILGLSYKPDTEVVEQSQGVMLANRLAEDNYSVITFDPMASRTATSTLDKRCRIANDLENALCASRMIVITTPWQEFLRIQTFDFSQETVVLDPWSLLDEKGCISDLTLVHIGRGTSGCDSIQLSSVPDTV